MGEDGAQDRKQGAAEEKSVIRHKVQRRPPVPYELLFWVLFLLTCGLFVIDRFGPNVWPRQSFSAKGFSYLGKTIWSNDKIGELKAGPFFVKFYDVAARFSGRHVMVALNALIFTMCHTIHHWFQETPFITRWVDFGDAGVATRIHRHLGWGLVFSTLIHIWSILFPCIFHGYGAQVIAGNFEFPFSERTPTGFKDVNNDTRMMSLQVDDVWRLVEMTSLFCVVLPLSLKWFVSRYNLGLQLHQFLFLMYFFDIWRRHSHPHSWVLNTPLLLLWIGDLVVGRRWRKHTSKLTKYGLGDIYMVVFWKRRGFSITSAVGPIYYLKHRSRGILHRAHPFTSMENHRQLPLPPAEISDPCWEGQVYQLHGERTLKRRGRSEKASGRTTRENEWDVGTVMRIYNRPGSITGAINDGDSGEGQGLEVNVWGGFVELGDVKPYLYGGAPVLLVGGGSGMTFLIDVLNQVNAEHVPLVLVFTSAEVQLFQFFCWMVEEIVEVRGGKTAAVFSNVYVTAVLSSPLVSKITDQNLSIGRVQLGRLDYDKLLEIFPLGHVFTVGGSGLQHVVKVAAKAHGSAYHGGSSFDMAPAVVARPSGAEAPRPEPGRVSKRIQQDSKFARVSKIWRTSVGLSQGEGRLSRSDSSPDRDISGLSRVSRFSSDGSFGRAIRKSPTSGMLNWVEGQEMGRIEHLASWASSTQSRAAADADSSKDSGAEVKIAAV